MTLVSVESNRVAAIGRAADVIGCSRITFSVMSTQVLKRVVIQIVYQREMPRRSIEVNISQAPMGCADCPE